jgi:acetyl-CoA C-acetyltransferase
MTRKNVAVIGIGQTPFKTHYADKNYVELCQAAAVQALAQARLSPRDIDAVIFSMAPTEFMGVNDADRWAVDSVFAAGKPFMRIHTGGATGGSALQAGFSHVASGLYRAVLVVGADRVSETPDAQHILNLIWDRFYEHDFALNTITMAAMAAQRYMLRYGATEEQFAKVVVGARRKASRNPNAHLKDELSVADVMRSPRVSWPFKRLDICPRSSGAAAMVLCDTDVAKAAGCTRPAWIRGTSAITHTVFLGDRMTFWADTELADHDGCHRAAREAYRRAGIVDPPREIQVAEVYDPFSSFLFQQLESLGFCRRGEGAAIHEEGGFDGAVVSANPSGGTLCSNDRGRRPCPRRRRGRAGHGHGRRDAGPARAERGCDGDRRLRAVLHLRGVQRRPPQRRPPLRMQRWTRMQWTRLSRRTT